MENRNPNEFRYITKEQVIFRDEKGRFKKPVSVPQPSSEPTLADRLSIVREELNNIEEQIKAPTSIELQLPELEGGAEMRILGDKLLKRKQKEVKEKSPKSYKEKLLVISDLQLLHETNEEGVGALLKYMDDQAKTFTHIVLNGDIIDFQQQSGFRKDNQLGDSVTQDEQVAGKWFIDFVNDKFGHCKKVFMFGNHENRYNSMYLDTNNGVQQYLRPFEEVFDLQGWEVHEYGNGESYDWHGRKIRHGTKAGLVQNIPKLEMDRAWKSTTVGHAVTNRMWETVDSDGDSHTSFVHAGFSKYAAYDKSGDKKPSNGFGVYYYSRVAGKDVENAYQVIIPANHSVFISPEGNLYSGKGFNLRKEIGLETRGRPRQ
ncbi:hypothetical protein M0R04_13425 [Candidatus Dojkabacteria bacterium]|jgi:hypothetical protein|nr:hypothetical protein [Candidatus Dojkabacteria bacterium]